MSANESLMPNSEDGKTPQSYNVETGQVKFTKDTDNVDVNASSKLIGLTKEQLEQYRNDPFWKPIRYALFVLFWLVWLLMFVGAILIVVLSPKCAAKEVTKWSKVAVAYQVFTPTFFDAKENDGVGDFEGIRQKLDYFRKIGATTIWARHVVQADKDEFDPSLVVDSFNVDKRLGSEEDFKKLVDAVHDKDLYFVMDLPLTVSKKHPYTKSNSAKKSSEPGNENLYVINLGESAVSDNLLKTAKKYLDLGVDGFYFSEYKATKDGFNKKHLEEFGSRIKEEVEKDENLKHKEILLFADSKLKTDAQNSSIEFYVKPLLDCPDKGVYECIYDTVTSEKQIANENPNGEAQPLWEITDLYGSRIDTKLKDYEPKQISKLGSLASLLQLFLRGPSSILYGEELATPSFDGTQRGYMRWTSEKEKNYGFSEESPLFFNTSEAADADVQVRLIVFRLLKRKP
jgi:glycosidase